MIIVPVKTPNSIEQALKQYKFKVYKTIQLEKLGRDRNSQNLQLLRENKRKKRLTYKKIISNYLSCFL